MRDDGSLPQVYGRPGVDASALVLVAFDLLPARDPRAAALVDATIRTLGAGPLLYRYPPDGRDGFDAGEAPFVPASWWAVTALAKLGHPDAQDRADELCRMLPMLQPEEFDPARREALGNTPLLWAHAECTPRCSSWTVSAASPVGYGASGAVGGRHEPMWVERTP